MAHAAKEPARLVYDSLPHAVLVLGRGGHILHANDAAERLLGTSGAAMRAKRPQDVWKITTEDDEPLRTGEELGAHALISGQPDRGMIYRLRTPDGRGLVLEVDTLPSLGADGAPYQAVCTLIDATGRQRVEAILLQSQREWRALVQTAGFGIARLDLRGRILTTNPAYGALLGYREDELRGRPLAGVIHPEDADHVSYAMLSELDTRRLQRDVRYVRSDGAPIWVNSVMSLARDAAGRPAFLVNAIEDITGRKAHQAELEHRVHHDLLTGLPNRARLNDLLDHAIAGSRPNGTSFALLIVDLDGFKEINDSRGHLAGDELLKQVAGRLRSHVRRPDTVGRMGGDEFGVILPGISGQEDAAGAARKLTAAIEVPFRLGEEDVQVTACIGAAVFPADGDDVEALFRSADSAMYVAKRARYRGTLHLATVEGQRRERPPLVDELQRAIAERSLVLHYQPQFDLETGAVTTVEALLRWPHPEHGLLTPDSFLAAAEEAGLIREIEFWVVEEALGRCREWRDAGLGARVAVNLSGSTLSDRGLPDHVDATCERLGLEPGCLQVEVTQSALTADPETVALATRRLSQMQVQIAIDDFGIGRASLDFVRHLRANELKIDRSFVLAMTRSRKDAVIVDSTIELGRNLGVRVVALGVEDEETRDILAGSGCELAQGFFLARPVLADEVVAQVREAGRARSGRIPVRRRGAISLEEVNRRLHVLEAVSLLMPLPGEHLRRLARNMTELTIKPGDIIDVRSTGATLHVIERGLCEVVTEFATAQPLLILGPYDVVGSSIVADESASVQLRALTECRLLTAGAEALSALVPTESEIFQRLLGLAQQRQSMITRLAASEDRRRSGSSLIAVCSSRGGAGKTTIAVNLAAEMARRFPEDVLLVDMALPYNDAALLAHLSPTTCVARAAELPQASFEMALRGGIHRHPSGFFVLSTALRPEEADLITSDLVTKMLGLVGEMFGYIVVDLGVALSEPVLCALEMADAILPVLNPELASMKDGGQLLDILNNVLRVPAPAVHLTINHRSAHGRMTRGDIERILQRTAAFEIGYDGPLPEEAALRGDLLVQTQPRSSIAQVVAEIARSLTSRHPDAVRVGVLQGVEQAG